MSLKIAPSILSADFSEMGKAVADIDKAGADLIHCDVMDGMFVPNITFGPKMIADLRSHTGLVLDTHLMVERPERYVDRFIDAGSDIVTVHVEASDKTAETLRRIKSRGVKCGVVVNPETDVSDAFEFLPMCDIVLIMSVHPGFGGQKFIAETLKKVRILKALAIEKGYSYEIEIDGGVNLENITQIAAAGADIAVAGSAVFEAKDVAAMIAQLKNA